MNKKDFDKLQKVWYKKLEKSGFIDIEDTAVEHNPLKRWSSCDFRNKARARRYGPTLDYFTNATHFLHDNLWESEADKKIWALHAEGLSIREIAKKTRYKYRKVQETIVRVKGNMYGDN